MRVKSENRATFSCWPLVYEYFIHVQYDAPAQLSTCQAQFYVCFLFSPSNSDEDSPVEAKPLLADVRDQLLQGLADDAENIR